jgi:hypothetical protein
MRTTLLKTFSIFSKHLISSKSIFKRIFAKQ